MEHGLLYYCLKKMVRVVPFSQQELLLSTLAQYIYTYGFSWPKAPLVACVIYFVLICYLFLAQGDQVYLFLAFAHEKCGHHDRMHVYMVNIAHICIEHKGTVAVKGQTLKRWCCTADDPLLLSYPWLRDSL